MYNKLGPVESLKARGMEPGYLDPLFEIDLTKVAGPVGEPAVEWDGKRDSYSQLSIWCQCPREHWYRYDEGFYPRRLQRYLGIGRAGHEALAAHFNGKNPTRTTRAWLKRQLAKAPDLFDEEIAEWKDNTEAGIEIAKRFISSGRAAEWEPVAVEKRIEFKLGGIPFVAVIDLVFADVQGALWLCDHKFTGSFSSEEEWETDWQLPLYIPALRSEGIEVVGTVYNQLLTTEPGVPNPTKEGVSRSLIRTTWPVYAKAVKAAGGDPKEYAEYRGPKGDQLPLRQRIEELEWSRQVFTPRSEAHVQNTMLETAEIARAFHARGPAFRIRGRHCQRCWFREPCYLGLDGGDEQGLLSSEFIRRERGTHGS